MTAIQIALVFSMNVECVGKVNEMRDKMRGRRKAEEVDVRRQAAWASHR